MVYEMRNIIVNCNSAWLKLRIVMSAVYSLKHLLNLHVPIEISTTGLFNKLVQSRHASGYSLQVVTVVIFIFIFFIVIIIILYKTFEKLILFLDACLLKEIC
jgi:hypothetical protein